MKKALHLIVCLCSCFCLFGKNAKPNDSKPKIVCSMNIISDICQQLGGECFDIRTLVDVGSDPHLHEATPKDARWMFDADLIFINGLHCEAWMEELIENSGTKAPVFETTKYINPLYKDQNNKVADPHAWMDPILIIDYIRLMSEALIEYFPQFKDVIHRNKETYIQKIYELHHFIQKEMNSIPAKQRIMVTTHDAFSYFARRYGLKVLPLRGTSTEADIESSTLNQIINAIKANDIKAIFPESTVNPKILYQISNQTGCVVGTELFADSVGEPNTNQGSYLGMMYFNVRTIYDGLSGKLPSSAHKMEALSMTNNELIWVAVLFILILFLTALKLVKP